MFEVIKLATSLLTFMLIVKSVNSRKVTPIHLVAFALWLRFSLSAFHEITFEPIVAGLSINALGSISVVCVGILFIPKSYFLYKKFLFLYAFLILIGLSALLNGGSIALANVYIKWLYMLTLSILLLHGYINTSLFKALRILLLPFLLPIILFFMSLVLGVSKPLELDGSTSYIGGYNHEAAFSMMIASALLIACIQSARPSKLVFYSVVILFFIVLLVNYRTTMLAIIPLTAITIFHVLNKRIAKSKQIISQTGSIALLGALFFLALIGNSERFVDFSRVFTQWDTIFQAPQYFSRAERILFSARLYIWSQYIYEFYQADLLHQLVGHGPESWNNNFNKYAHNTFISYLYEYGIVGVLIFIIFISHVIVLAIKVPVSYFRSLCIGACIGFLLLNMATMPLWNIEGIIFFSLFYSFILYNQLMRSSVLELKKEEDKSKILSAVANLNT
jgi:hypothetical protein